MAGDLLIEREPTARAAAEPELPELVIEARRGLIAVDWAEIWRFRELLYFLSWRDVKIRYKQTVLGGAWAIIQPFTQMVVFTVFFGRLAGLDKLTEGIPYPIWVYTGLIAWTFFANGISNSGVSLVNNSNLISKVYFPRLIVPFASTGLGLVDFAVSALVLLGMMVFYHVSPTFQLVFLPLLLGATVLAAAGVGTFLAALTVTYRDFRYVVPFLVQIWMFVSAVMYPISLVPQKWRWALVINPMAGLVDGFRSCFLGRPLDWPHLSISLAVSVLVFFAGAAYFRSVERRFADVI